MNTGSIFRLCLTFLLIACNASAENLSAVKQRMQQRLPELVQLWQQGKIGEANNGFVAVPDSAMPATAETTSLVQAENTDRLIVYRSIANETNSTPEKVGSQRAGQIARRAAKGLLLQDAKGRWYYK